MNSGEIRQKFLNYFKNQAECPHSVLDSASVITSDEKGLTNSTLFNTAGVQPIIPYILSGTHPNGPRLVSCQKCIRTVDIDDVGDNRHLTFFEMLGNWSLGDYFKKEAIAMSYEFLTDSKIGLGLKPERLFVTVFSGNQDAPKDTEAYEIWKQIFEKAGFDPNKKIFFLESNWWSAGENGPCGPDTEMFYDLTENGLGEISHQEFVMTDENSQVIEIWNNVFMQFEKKDNQIIGPLKNFAVDTGAGLERLVTVINQNKTVFETDMFNQAIQIIQTNSTNFNDRSARIIADHLRASIILIADGVVPSNSDRGYVLRKILRRMLREIHKINFDEKQLVKIYDFFINKLGEVYTDVSIKKAQIIDEINNELDKFKKTLEEGLREFRKIKGQTISGQEAFKLFTSYGMPIELIQEIASENNQKIDLEQFQELFNQHQELSRTSAAGKFKGGLSGNSEIEKRYHTATHLLHQALFDVLGQHVEQKGSNINSERLRFDFSHSEKMSAEQITKVEELVNEKIESALPVNKIELPIEEAKRTGAKHFFNQKYGDTVSVYYIGENLENAYSKEFCGGPHVSNTNMIGKFKIIKEESVSQGIRRIKAIVE